MEFLKIPALARQATLASGIGSLESIPLLLMKNENESENDFFFKAKKNDYIRTSTIEGTKENELICS
jgi:hypothetical protein